MSHFTRAHKSWRFKIYQRTWRILKDINRCSGTQLTQIVKDTGKLDTHDDAHNHRKRARKSLKHKTYRFIWIRSSRLTRCVSLRMNNMLLRASSLDAEEERE